jgi:hypothetical protein
MIVRHCRDEPKEWYSVYFYLVINHEARFLWNFIDRQSIRIFLDSECYRMFQDDDYVNVDYHFDIVKKNQDGLFYSYIWFDVYKALREKENV